MHGRDQYLTYQTETAGPEERVALLYDGARRFVDLAGAGLAAERYDQVGQYCGKAQRILVELSAALDLSHGEIPANLFRLYEYWSWRLTQGLTRRDPEAFREVSAALMDMHGAWVEAAKAVRALRPARSIG